MKTKNRFLVLNFFIALCIISSLTLKSSASSTAPSVTVSELRDLVQGLNKTYVKESLDEISSFQTRVTGYPQFRALTDFLIQKITGTGVSRENIYVQNYSVVVPIDYGSKLILRNSKGESISEMTCYAVWPNLIQTSKTISPISAPLVYGYDGSFEKLSGKNVADSVVLLDFDSGKNWINVASLGARGAIFILPENEEGYPGSFNEALQKFSLTPFYFPRVAVTYDDGQKIKELLSGEKSIYANLLVNMSLVETTGSNIIVTIPGNEKPNEGIVVTTHYDSWSVVPALARNQDEATSISALLELIRYYMRNPPKRTLIFVFLSGHWEALAGAREFTDWFLFTNNSIIKSIKPLILINIDLSTDSDTLAFLYRGFMYDFGSSSLILRWTKWLVPKIFDEYLVNIEKATGARFNTENGFRGDYGWWTTIGSPYILDSEPWAIAHCLSFSMRTSSSRLSWGLPSARVNFDNLWPQITLISGIVYQLQEESKIDVEFQPMRYLFTAAGGDIAGFMTVQGTVVEFDVKRSWFVPVPESIVVARRQGIYSSEYPFTIITTIADENGTFELHGVSGYGYGHGYGRTDQWEFIGFHISNITGMIDYAPDLGQYGRQFPSLRMVDRPLFPVTISVFKCSSIVLFDLTDPLRMIPKQFSDPRFRSSAIGGVSNWYSEPSQISVISYVTLSEPIFWGFFLPPFETVGMAFVEPNQKTILLYRLGPSLDIIAILTNSSLQYPEGFGYKAYPSGYQMNLNFTVLKLFEDTFRLANSRYEKISESYVRNTYAEEDIKESKKYLNLSLSYFKENRYDLAFSDAFIGWNYAIHSYVHTMSVINDILNVDFFFMSLFVLTSIFIERLLFNTAGVKRIISTSSVGIFLFSLFYLVNPASRIVMSFIMLPLAVSIFMLLLFILVIFLSEAGELARTYRIRTMGQHAIERPSGSLIQLAFSYGSQNLRKRKLRTTLVLLTVVSIAFATVAFTSSYAVPRISYSISLNAVPSYKGLLIKADVQRTPANIISQEFVNWIKTSYPELMVSERVWMYPQSRYGQQVYDQLRAGSNIYPVTALLGVNQNEVLMKNNLQTLITKGQFFSSDDVYSILISEEAAKSLNVEVGSFVSLGPYSLLVRGIYNTSRLNSLKDLDGYSILPVNPSSIQSIVIGPIVSQGLGVNYLSGEQVAIVPSVLALKLGGYIASVSISTNDFSAVENLSNMIAYAANRLIVFTCDGKEVKSPVLSLGLTLQGWATMLIPLAIGVLIVLDTMIAGVMERTSEIKTYSAVGVAPSQISVIFISEALIYALVSAVIGYIMGVVANIFLIKYGILPSNFIVNTSSLPTALAVAAVLISTLVSTIYPSWIASRLVTPSLERQWRLPTKPKGDEWAIPMPFSTKDLTEARGLLRYLREYLEAHKVETPERFIVTGNISLDETLGVLACNMALQPLEANITQKVEIISKTLEARVSFEVRITKLSGPRDVWESTNYLIVDSLRKQMLLWRSLSPSERNKYVIERGDPQ